MDFGSDAGFPVLAAIAVGEMHVGHEQFVHGEVGVTATRGRNDGTAFGQPLRRESVVFILRLRGTELAEVEIATAQGHDSLPGRLV